MRNTRPTLLIVCLALMLLLNGCGNETQNPAGTGMSENASLSAEADASATESAPADAPSARTEPSEDSDAPDIRSRELTRFRFDAGDPEQTGPASPNGQAPDALNSAFFHFTLAASDLHNAASPVTCQISYRRYTEPEDGDFHTVSFDADASDLSALQTLVEERGLIGNYCNFDDKTDAVKDRAYARMSFEYASDESAWHYCNTACDVSADDRLAVYMFFSDLLVKYNVRFYFHPVEFAEDEDFIEAFLGQDPWDALQTTTGDGESVLLLLTSDPTGRVFRLTAGEDVYAGNYKLKKREKDGRWRLDLTLTTWPAEYTPMTKGGSILIDTAVGPYQAGGGGTETLSIAKYPDQKSLFDPFYGEEGLLTFTRRRTEYFREKPFAVDMLHE